MCFQVSLCISQTFSCTTFTRLLLVETLWTQAGEYGTEIEFTKEIVCIEFGRGIYYVLDSIFFVPTIYSFLPSFIDMFDMCLLYFISQKHANR